MQTTPRVVFKGLPVSDAAEAAALRRITNLQRFSPRITGCRVVIARPHNNHAKGDLFSVRIDLLVPGGEIVVNREHRFDQAHTDLAVAMRDAFRAARRKLEDRTRLIRARVRPHARAESTP